jgi:hypothetical protein
MQIPQIAIARIAKNGETAPAKAIETVRRARIRPSRKTILK